jgi:hypothetical protein
MSNQGEVDGFFFIVALIDTSNNYFACLHCADQDWVKPHPLIKSVGLKVSK